MNIINCYWQNNYGLLPTPEGGGGTKVKVLVLQDGYFRGTGAEKKETSFKGIVSQDWGELQMIPVDRSEVFSIAGSYFYSFLTTFSCLNV